MSVYVDDLVEYGTAYRRERWCHLWADSQHELLGMAAKLGLKSWWVHTQFPEFRHFDLSPAKREAALKYGAIYNPKKGENHVKYRKKVHGEPFG